MRTFLKGIRHLGVVAALFTLMFCFVAPLALAAVEPASAPTPTVTDAASYQAPIATPAADHSAIQALLAASEPPPVQVEIGNWLSDLLLLLGTTLTAIVSFYVHKVAEKYVGKTASEQLDKYLGMALQFGINATAGAVKGKTYDFQTGSEIVEWMVHYANQTFPGLVAKFGGEAALRLRAWARVPLDADAVVPVVQAQSFIAPRKVQRVQAGDDPAPVIVAGA